MCSLKLGSKICVFDVSEEKREFAKKIPQIGSVVDSQADAIAGADLIILAICSGVAIKPEDLPSLSPESIILGVTSADDLLAPNTFQGNPDYEELQLPGNIDAIAFQHKKTGQIIYLVAGGKTANFIVGGTPHPIIHAIFASECVTAHNAISSRPATPTATIGSPPLEQDEKIYEILQDVYGGCIGRFSALRLATNMSTQTEISPSPFLARDMSDSTSKSVSVFHEQATALRRQLTEQEALGIFEKSNPPKYSKQFSAIVTKLEMQPLLVNLAAAYIGQHERTLKAINEYLEYLTINEAEEDRQSRIIKRSMQHFSELGGQSLLQFLAVIAPKMIPFDLMEVYFGVLHEDGKIFGGHTLDSLVKTAISLALVDRCAIYVQQKSEKSDDMPCYLMHPQVQAMAGKLNAEFLVDAQFLSIIVKTAYQWLHDHLQGISCLETQEDLLAHVERIISHVKKHSETTVDNSSLAADLAGLVSLFVTKKIALGDKFCFQKDVEKALDNYDDAARCDPNNVSICLKRIDMLTFFRRHHQDTLDMIQRIRESSECTDEQKFKMLYQEALIWVRMNRGGHALHFLLSDLGDKKYCVNSVELLIARMNVLIELNIYDSSQGCIDISRLYTLSGTKVYRNIFECIDSALQLEPKNIFVLNLRGWLLLRNDQNYQAAEQNFRAVLETCDDMTRPHFNLAEALLAQRKVVEALDHFIRAFELANTAEMRDLIFNRLTALGQQDDCREFLIEVLKKISHHPSVAATLNTRELILFLQKTIDPAVKVNREENKRGFFKKLLQTLQVTPVIINDTMF